MLGRIARSLLAGVGTLAGFTAEHYWRKQQWLADTGESPCGAELSSAAQEWLDLDPLAAWHNKEPLTNPPALVTRFKHHALLLEQQVEQQERHLGTCPNYSAPAGPVSPFVSRYLPHDALWVAHPNKQDTESKDLIEGDVPASRPQSRRP